MEILHPSCAGIDIGKRSLMVCVITNGLSGEPAKPTRPATRTFGTLTSNLLALADWLDERGITAVAMEATGSYWKPIWNLRSPKLHGAVERANRTHTEEFYEVTMAEPELEAFQAELRAWETVYNTIRSHQSLGYLTPAEYLASVGVEV
jgi:hypothetical protein